MEFFQHVSESGSEKSRIWPVHLSICLLCTPRACFYGGLSRRLLGSSLRLLEYTSDYLFRFGFSSQQSGGILARVVFKDVHI
jgi:hypothetical protein